LIGYVYWQIFGDPDAADIVFTCGADILAVGINITHQVVLSGNPLAYKIFFETHILERHECNYCLDSMVLFQLKCNHE
jgi:hypothetical protein